MEWILDISETVSAFIIRDSYTNEFVDMSEGVEYHVVYE
jgi:hypothetical protein